MITKSLSSRQVWWAQDCSCYHFQIDYHQGEANAAADSLSRFPQRSQSEEQEFGSKTTQILYQLQSSLTNTRLSGLSLLGHTTRSQAEACNLLPFYQVLIYGTYVLPRLCQF